jgi:hypothetical protein
VAAGLASAAANDRPDGSPVRQSSQTNTDGLPTASQDPTCSIAETWRRMP